MLVAHGFEIDSIGAHFKIQFVELLGSTLRPIARSACGVPHEHKAFVKIQDFSCSLDIYLDILEEKLLALREVLACSKENFNMLKG